MKAENVIAKNTFFLYIRMFVVMITTLFTSRAVLDVLGVADYGLNNIISGVIVMFSFVNNALLSATQYLLNINIGRNDKNKIHSVFCMSMNAYLTLSLIVVLLGETLGLWFFETQLNIPHNRMYAAHWVYQFTILQFIFNLLRIPYNAVIVAYEHMNFYAYISFIEVFMKLLVTYLLYIFDYDKLIAYALLYTIVNIVIMYIYKAYCNHRYPITRYKYFWNKNIFNKLFKFSGWSLLGNLANITSLHGVNILLNIFYGVTINAAVGISNQVVSSIYGFISNFQTAFQPQIVKSYAINETARFHKLIFQTTKFSYFMMFVLIMPIMFTLDGLLKLWLAEVPEYTATFCRLTLIFMAIESVSAPLYMAVQATGNIRTYQIMVASLIVLNLPLSLFLLFLGYPPHVVFIVKIIINIVLLGARCLYIQKRLDFPLLRFIKDVYIPIGIVTILTWPIPYFVYISIKGFWFNLISAGTVSLIISLTTVFYIGMNYRERKFAVKMVTKHFLDKKIV